MNPTTTSPAELLSGYTNAIHMIERLHRRLLDVVTGRFIEHIEELERRGIF